MPAPISLSALKQNNLNPSRDANAEEARLKNLSSTISQYAEDPAPPPAEEPSSAESAEVVATPIDHEALIEEILQKVSSQAKVSVVTSKDIAAATIDKYGAVEREGERSNLRKSIPPQRNLCVPRRQHQLGFPSPGNRHLGARELQHPRSVHRGT